MQQEEEFRDHLSTLDESGDRKWIYPKKPDGKWYDLRKYLSYVLLLALFATPWLRIGGEPVLMLNIIERRFVILGNIFWPQDFFIFGIATVTLILFVVLFTVAFGRIFCGWFCPQTIFMEMLFRRIEYWIEGDWKHQQKLDKQPWNAEKIRKKGLKHFLFLGISFIIANTFLAYIIGSDELVAIITDPPSEHIVGLVAIIIFTFVFYGVFAKIREQVCTNICPYGRLQGVLLDRNSMIVAYDHERGEGRGKWRKNEVRSEVGKGDCIDCNACVDVCPTGIDIRNGTQLECINCTACMDACDNIMDRVGFEKGLVRYASENSIVDKTPFILTARMKAYGGVLTVLTTILFILIFTRSDVGVTVLRTPGMLYQTQDDGRISNLYQYKVINKTNGDMPLSFELMNKDGDLNLVGDLPTLEMQGTAEGALFIVLPKEQLDGHKSKLKIGVYSGDELLTTTNTNFIGPAPGTK